jgi:hypothetical protein
LAFRSLGTSSLGLGTAGKVIQPAQQILGKRTNMMQLTDIERELFLDWVPAKVETTTGPAIKQETNHSQNQIKMAA